MNSSEQSEIPGVSTKLVIKFIGAGSIVLLFLVISYIGLNQPVCPLCQDRQFVKYTLMLYTNENSPSQNLRNIGMAGLNVQSQNPEKKGPHCCWYCFKHKKTIIKPDNWRSG